MSLADYSMQMTALSNLQKAQRKIREITSWYGKMLKSAKDEIQQANRMKNAMKQQIQASVFAYTSKLQMGMNAALTSNNGQKDEHLYQSLFLQYNQAQERGKMYLASYEEQVDETLRIKQEAYDEMEVNKKTEIASEEANRDFWQRIHDQSKQNYAQGLQNDFSTKG